MHVAPEREHFMGSRSKSVLSTQMSAVEALRTMAGGLGSPQSSGDASGLPKVIATPADLGAIVKAVRKRRKMSQAEFADLAGVGRRFLSEFEAGKATLEIGKVLLALTAAGVDLVAQER